MLTTAEIPVGAGRRRRRVSPHVVLALRANAALRGLGGFLTIFAAFLVQAEFPAGGRRPWRWARSPWRPALGSFVGTAVGSRLHAPTRPRSSSIAAGVAAAITVLAAVFYSFAMAAVVAGVAAVTNALGKVSLDAIIQREVPESLRASAFARSETMLQLAWVVGGALGIALPATGWIGLHRRRGAAGPRRRARGLEHVPRSRGASHAGRPPDAPTTPWGRSGPETERRGPAARRSCCRLRLRRAGPARATSGCRSAPRTSPPPPCSTARTATGQRYENTPPIIEVSPDADITLTVPESVAERGWSVQVFDEKLEETLGEVDVPEGEAGSTRSTRSDVVPPAFYLVVVEDKGGDCGECPGRGRSASCGPAAT